MYVLAKFYQTNRLQYWGISQRIQGGIEKAGQLPLPSARIMADARQKSQIREIIDQSKTAIWTKRQTDGGLCSAIWRPLANVLTSQILPFISVSLLFFESDLIIIIIYLLTPQLSLVLILTVGWPG